MKTKQTFYWYKTEDNIDFFIYKRSTNLRVCDFDADGAEFYNFANMERLSLDEISALNTLGQELTLMPS